MERKDIEQRYKWKVEDIFPSDEAWEAEFAAIEKDFADADFASYQGKLADKNTLLAFNKLNDNFSRRLEKLYLYAHMCNDQDVRVSKYNSYMARMGTLISKFAAASAFVEPELSKLDDETLAEIVKKEFDLRPYAIIKTLDLRKPVFKKTAAYGHFGYKGFSWEQTDRVEDLKKYL